MLTRFFYYYYHPLVYFPLTIAALILGCYFLSIGSFFLGITFTLIFVTRFRKRLYENIWEDYGDRFTNTNINVLIFCDTFLESQTFKDIYHKLTENSQIKEASDFTEFKEFIRKSLEQKTQEQWDEVRSNIPYRDQWDSFGDYGSDDGKIRMKRILQGIPIHFKIFQGRILLNGKPLEVERLSWQFGVNLSIQKNSKMLPTRVHLAFRVKVENGVLKFQIGDFDNEESIFIFSGEKATLSLRWYDITSFPLIFFPCSLCMHSKFLNMGSSNFEEFYLFFSQGDRNSLKNCRKVNSENRYKLFLYKFFPSVEEIFSDKLGFPWRFLTLESGLLKYRHEFLLREKFITKEDYLGRFDNFGSFENQFMKISMDKAEKKSSSTNDFNLKF